MDLLIFLRSVSSLQSVLPRYNTNSIANKTLKRRSSSTTCGQLNVTLLAAEWGSIKHGDLSTVNRELAINLAKVQECKNEKVKVQVTFFVPKCSHQERGEAKTFNVAIAEAKKYPGMDIYTCLCFPTGDLAIDVVIGHDVKLGGQAQIIKEQHNCKWVQVVHTDPKDPNGQTENKDVIKLCENADLVMTVGPKLKEVYSSQLRGCEREDNVFEFTPGIMEELDIQHALHDNATFKVLFLGRTDLKNFKQKGYDIAVKAFKNELKGENYCLVFVCAPEKRVDEVAEYLRSAFGIPEEQFEVKAFVESREDLKGLFREVDLAIMPSRTEGFGLTALEAFSAGLPVLVSNNSGFAHALREIKFGDMCIVDSDDPKKWAEQVRNVRKRNREIRLYEIELRRSFYKEKYSWQKQCAILVEKIWDMVDGKKCFIQK